MKAAIVTNLDERCGVGEYARNLRRELQKAMEVDLVSTMPFDRLYDVVFINYHPAVVQFSIEQVRALKKAGTKVVLIVHEQPSLHRIVAGDSYLEMDAVVAHEPVVGLDNSEVNFHFIQFGATMPGYRAEYKLEDGLSVGTCGFAFPAKGMDLTVRVAHSMGGKSVVIAPQHAWRDPKDLYAEWHRLALGSLELITDWLPDIEVSARLSHCTMNIYFADGDDGLGQSGSARMILAAGRPTIVRAYRKTSALFPYQDEIYFARDRMEVYMTARHICSELQAGRPVKMPDKVLEAISWETVGKQFADLAKELCLVGVGA